MAKKILAAILAAAMALSLVACSSSSDTSSDSSSSSSDSSSSDSSSDDTSSDESDSSTGLTNDGTNFVDAICWSPDFNIYALEVAAEYYQLENPDFTIEITETPWDDVQTRLITTATSGTYDDMTDIFLLQNNAYQKNVGNYPDLFLALTDYDIPWDEYGEAVLNYSTYEGENYGIPFDNGAAVTALRTDYLAQAGYTLEDFTDITWEEYIEMGQDVIANSDAQGMLSQESGSGDLLIMMIKTTGTSLFDENGDPYIAENEALAEALELYVEMVETGVIVLYSSGDEVNAAFVNGTVASMINGCWNLSTVQIADDQSGLWGVTNFPRFGNIEGSVNYSENGGSSWAISKSSTNSEIALDYLVSTFASSTEFYDAILLDTAAISNWLPAAESELYSEGHEYYDGQAIYADIVEYSSNVLPFNTGVYYYDAQDAVGVAVADVMGGTSIEDALAAAQNTIEFAMS